MAICNFSCSFALPWHFDSSSLSQPTHVSSSSSSLQNPRLFTTSSSPKTPSLPVSISIYRTTNCTIRSRRTTLIPLCRAAKHERISVKKRPPSRKKGFPGNVNVDDVEPRKKGFSRTVNVEDDMEDDGYSLVNDKSQRYQTTSAIPKPPAGFVLDPDGKVLMVSSRRLVSIVDATNNLPLECIIRRVFRSSRGEECMLLCPVDMPVQVVKSTNLGWSDLSDEEMEAILPASAYALAKIHIHLVQSGFCYTARGGFCYSEGAIFEIGTDNGPGVDGIPTEAVEVTCFHQDGIHYMIYTPSDPLLFVAVKDNNGLLQIADDDLMDDPAVVEAIDEETEFNALAEEEAALLESTMGECYDSD